MTDSELGKTRAPGVVGRCAAFYGVAALLFAGCASTPSDVERIRAENELLKAEIEVIKRNCSYYRDVEIQVEEEEGGETP